MFECKRCGRLVENEEARLLNKDLYCRACMNTIENDPDYQWILTKPMWRLREIEN